MESNRSSVISTTPTAIGAYHIRSEEMVRASGLAWPFLRPRTFMTNTLQWREQLAEADIVRAYGDPPVATVDVLAGALQRPLTFEPLTAAEARADMTGTMPQPYLEAFLRFPAEGALVETDVHPAVARILGRPANNFAQ